jgi:hypothetical protein
MFYGGCHLEGNELGKQCSVSEHKPIFIAACNMANTSDRIEFYGEDYFDRFLTLVFQDKKYNKCTTMQGDTIVSLSCAGLSATARNLISSHRPHLCIGLFSSPTMEYALSTHGISSPLSKFGKRFGLMQSKTDFPRAFSRRENFEYEGPMPPFDTPDDFYSLKHIKGMQIL